MKAACKANGAVGWLSVLIGALASTATACTDKETKTSSASSGASQQASAKSIPSSAVPGDSPAESRAVIDAALPLLDEHMKVMASIAPPCRIRETVENGEHQFVVSVPSLSDADLGARFSSAASSLNLTVSPNNFGGLHAEDPETHWSVAVFDAAIVGHRSEKRKNGEVQVIAEHQMLGATLIEDFDLQTFKVIFVQEADGSQRLDVDVFAEPAEEARIERWASSVGLDPVSPRASRWGSDSPFVWKRDGRGTPFAAVDMELSRPVPIYSHFVLTQGTRGSPINPFSCLNYSDHFFPKPELNPFVFLCSVGGFSGDTVVKCDASKEYCQGPPPCCDQIGRCVAHAPCPKSDRVSCACLNFDPRGFSCEDRAGGARLIPILRPVTPRKR